MNINNTIEDLNLDAMTIDELHKFSTEIPFAVRAKQLFPDRPYGYLKVTRILMHYAFAKEIAMKHRLSGNIPLAFKYEAVCRDIYSALPDWAKGW